MTELKIRNWQKWQSYRGDRGQPPWIKVHRCVMRDPAWVELTDAQRGQLVAIWLLAADRNGAIPASPATIRKLCYLDSDPDLQLFVDKGFIEPDANMTPSRRQHDVPEAETETETETETEREKETTAVAVAADCFQGKVVRLNAKDFASWQSAYRRLDLGAELTARDEWLAEQAPDVQRKWFQSTSKYLANRNMEARAKGELKAQPYKSRTQQAFDQLDEVIKHGTGGLGLCEAGSTAALLEFPQPGARSVDVRGAVDEGARGPAKVCIASFGRPTDGLPCDSEIPDDRGC